MGKMQFLGVLAIVLAVYNVHATVYFREEFLDGGKFGLDFFSPYRKLCWGINFHFVHVALNFSHTCLKSQKPRK